MRASVDRALPGQITTTGISARLSNIDHLSKEKPAGREPAGGPLLIFGVTNEAEFFHSVLNRLISSRLRIEPGDHLPQRRREVLIVTLHGILPAIPGMVALFRAVQVIVRTRLTDRERPFSVIGPAPCEMSVEGIDAHDMTRALLALRIDEGTRLALINFHLMLLFLSGASREIQK